jgi:phosphoribosylformimino-5-aminoimidazole carboxamide ribotide isomerase
VIASGGVTNMDDIIALCKVEDAGITGTILGRSIYEGAIDLAEAHQYVESL